MQHLPNWYAQAHPEEDFSETFAVWLGSPPEEWRQKYNGWKSLEKLEYIHSVMQEVAGTKPAVTKGRRSYEASKLRKTLAKYYAGRRKTYAEDFPDFYDADLRAIFSDGDPGGESAAKVMRKHRAALIASIVQWTGQRKYTVSMLVRQTDPALPGVEADGAARSGSPAVRAGRLSRDIGDQSLVHWQIQEVRVDMKILVLFDIAQRADPEEKFTPESLREQQKPTEASVLDSLQRLGHQVETLAVFDNVTTIVEKLKACAPDIVFNLTESFHHDRSHEPNIPALLELMKVRYTGAGPEGLLLCKDKALAKKVLAYHRVRLPRFVVSHQARPVRGLQRFKYPAFVKPVGEESSDGIAKASFVRTAEEAMERVRYIHQKFDCDVLIEEYIEGRELYLSVLGNRRLTVFPPREIFFEQVPDDVPKFATSHAKWNEKYREKWGIKNGPAGELPAGVEEHLKQLARKVYRVLKIHGFGRVDVRLTPQGDVFVIEANPNPSLAEDEDFAQAALSSGMTYDALITEILSAAQV